MPFKLKNSLQRVDETNIHEAIREALVNTLIHANYNGHIGIKMIKHPKGYSFRNPGLLRISKDEAFIGGHSDCRNKTLQKMFQLIGMGEQAGSGFPKMLRAWMEQHWQYPYLDENTQLETTTLFLPTISLFPQEIQNTLEKLFGDVYISLNKDERLALILAFVEGEVSNGRLSNIGAIHSSDASKILKKLVDMMLLISNGIGRGTKYSINEEFDKNEKLHIKNNTTPPKSPPQILSLLKKIDGENTRDEIMQKLNLKDRKNFRENYINQALKSGVVTLTIPEKPQSSKQKYKLTELGKKILK